MTKTKKPRNLRPLWEEIFASFGDGLVILDTEKMVIGMNPAAELITGSSAESTLGRTLKEAFPENEDILTKLSPPFEEGIALTLREVLWKRSHREKATVDLSATPLIGDEGDLDGWILVFRDMTPIKNLQEEVRKADRLAMMGTIAAGLAHEIKNPLGGIKGAAQLLERENFPAESRECLQIIIKEAERVDRLIGRLLDLTRPKTLSLEPINVNELIDSLLLLEKGPIESHRIRIVREFDPSLPSVLGGNDELRQAFLNFIKNALEAVKDRTGEIRIRSRLMTDFKIKEAQGKKPSRVILVEIQDNGVGISIEALSQIFTPFFTTKNTGSGLGLVIAQRIINEHGGSVRVVSEVGKGTTIQVTLRSSL